MSDTCLHLRIFCGIFKKSTHQKADEVGELSGIVEGCNQHHSPICQPTEQRHFPPTLEVAPADGAHPTPARHSR